MQFAAVYMTAVGFVAFIKEFPGANTQGATWEVARENLQEAVELILDANRELTRRSFGDQPVIRGRF